MALPTPPPLALYIHLPWCVRKCPYCDFNSHARPAELPETAYVDALLADLEQDLPLVADRPLVSVFFGGGTPSLFSGAAIQRLLDGVRARIHLPPQAEVTLETNPGTAEHGRFEDYLAAGVNRLSFGVQTFDDARLKVLGRIHGSTDVQRAYTLARNAGFRNINLDLMYALPGQDVAAALADVDQAIALAPEHLSHYHLTLEPNTLFAAKPPPDLPDDDTAWDIQEACQARIAAAGYAHYEVSAYARTGLQCQHNLNYWQFGDYLGIGAGAHAKLSLTDGTIIRHAKQKHPRLYLETAYGPQRLHTAQTLDPTTLPFEFMLNALRLIDGVPQGLYAERTGLTLADHPAWTQALQRGLVDPDPAWIRPSALGQRFLNDLMQMFLG